MIAGPRDSSPAVVAAYRRLALRVIQQALLDLDCASPLLRQSARAFLGGDPPFDLWCDVAQVVPSCVTSAATGRLSLLARRPGRARRLTTTAVPRSGVS